MCVYVCVCVYMYIYIYIYIAMPKKTNLVYNKKLLKYEI